MEEGQRLAAPRLCCPEAVDMVVLVVLFSDRNSHKSSSDKDQARARLGGLRLHFVPEVPQLQQQQHQRQTVATGEAEAEAEADQAIAVMLAEVVVTVVATPELEVRFHCHCAGRCLSAFHRGLGRLHQAGNHSRE